MWFYGQQDQRNVKILPGKMFFSERGVRGEPYEALFTWENSVKSLLHILTAGFKDVYKIPFKEN